jgi:hypothetical protein
MALIACAECGRQISERAPACPHCGMPLAIQPGHAPTMSQPSAPASALVGSPAVATATPVAEAKKRTSSFTWLVLLALSLGAVWYFQMGPGKNQSKPDMPVAVKFRSAITGPGLVLSVENTSTRHLSIVATLKNPSVNDSRNFRMDIAPEAKAETGYREGWRLASGDLISLSHDDYKTWNGSIP